MPEGSSLFLLCDNGLILKDVGSGSAATLAVPNAGRLQAFQFTDANRGYVASDSGAILTTRDGGRSWERFDAGIREHFTDLRVVGDDVWAAGYNGTILHSADGGRNWQRQPTFTSGSIEGLYFLDRNCGWAVGWLGLVLRTVDGGRSWQQVSLPGVWETLSSVYFLDRLNGWAVGMDGLILRSRDGGVSWDRQPVPAKSWLTSVVFSPDGTGWIAAESSLLRSDDHGKSWRVAPLATSEAVTRLYAARETIVAIGPASVLMRPRNRDAWMKLDVDPFVAAASRKSS